MFTRKERPIIAIRSNLARRRRRRKRRALFLKSALALGIFLAVLFGAVALTRIEALQFREVRVKDTEYVDAALLRESVLRVFGERRAMAFPKRNIFVLDTEELAARIKTEYPRISDVQLEKNILSRALLVNVSERELWAVLCKPREWRERGCFYISKDGVAFDKAPEFRGTLITKIRDERKTPIVIGSRALDGALLSIVRAFKSAADVYPEISRPQFTFREGGRIDIATQEGWNILLDAGVDASSAIDHLLLALHEEIKERRGDLQYIDLRFGNRVFYKYR